MKFHVGLGNKPNGIIRLEVGLCAFYFSHHDWPRGKQFIVGYILLTALFLYLAVCYLGLFLWRMLPLARG